MGIIYSKRDYSTGKAKDMNVSSCFYYLHTNGTLHRKAIGGYNTQDFDESSFVQKYWVVTPNILEDLLMFVVKAKRWGANKSSIDNLIHNHHISYEELVAFNMYLNEFYYPEHTVTMDKSVI